MRIMGLNAPGLSPISPNAGDPTAVPDSFLSNITGSLWATNFDADRALMSRGEWQLANQERVEESLQNFSNE